MPVLLVSCAALLASCGKNESPLDPALLPQLAPDGWADAAGGFIDRVGEPNGYGALAASPTGGVLIRVDLMSLAEGWHAIHLHQVGDCSDPAAGFMASGGHIDPDERAHGLLNPDGPERADLPNIYAGADGRATAEIYAPALALLPSEASAAAIGPYAMIDDDGFAIIIHEGSDDHVSQPIGGAGGRVACAAILSGL
ncbi:MAG: superoxide dismutase family protein [Pseudomonadota bacterium]